MYFLPPIKVQLVYFNTLKKDNSVTGICYSVHEHIYLCSKFLEAELLGQEVYMF